jgi:uncharacterized protein (UPF0335 family)
MDTGGIVGAHLLAFVQRYERLQEEIDELNDDKGELMQEVEGNGFDKKIFKIVITRRRMGKDQCDEEDTLVELYERALEEKTPEPRAGAGAPAPARESEPIIAGDESETPAGQLTDLSAEREAALQDPFAAGKAAALQGFNETRNPLDHPSVESADWLRGHSEGVIEREAARATSGKRRRHQANGAEREGAEATV